jgi:NAD(P)-dependent dehydrogenase (short-subunit alcohol dehydrogenase family)
MSNLNGVVALVTGAANGIGKALCVEIAKRGGKVVVADIERDNAERVAAELRAAGTDALAVLCDVTKAESIEAAKAEVVARFGKLNLLCNNAGVIVGGDLEKTREADMRWMYEVNVFGVIRCTQVFLPLLKEAAARGEFAHVLNTGSENSLGVPIAGPCSVYTSTKHAVLGVADTLRRDMRDANTGVGVTLVCPAVVNTELWNATRNRPAELGGAKQGNPASAELFRQANSPESVAIAGLDGCEANEFLVIPHPEVESFTRKRAHELLTAMDACKQRNGGPGPGF